MFLVLARWATFASVVVMGLVLTHSVAEAGPFSLGDGYSSKAGSVWTGVSYSHWSADQIFAGTSRTNPSRGIQLGDPVPFDQAIGGRLETNSVFLNVKYTPIEHIETGFSFAPYQRIQFENQNSKTVTTGTSDIWSYLAYGFGSYGEPFGSRVGIQLKIPTTDRQLRNQDSIPLSEGQYDIAIEQATSFAPTSSLHLTLRTLIRHRFPYRDRDI